MNPVDWAKVEELRSRSFYGRNYELSPEEQSLLRRAIAEDPERYNAIGKDLREEYARSFR